GALLGTGGGTAGHRWGHCWEWVGGASGRTAERKCGGHCWAPIIRALIISALMIAGVGTDHQGTDDQCPDDRCPPVPPHSSAHLWASSATHQCSPAVLP
ncbi:unnamed protein product, partial [Staurois parvus]